MASRILYVHRGVRAQGRAALQNVYVYIIKICVYVIMYVLMRTFRNVMFVMEFTQQKMKSPRVENETSVEMMKRSLAVCVAKCILCTL